MAASGVFTAINSALLAQLIHRTIGLSTWEVWREESRLSALMAGASCYLTKPFDPDNLLSWVERMLS